MSTKNVIENLAAHLAIRDLIDRYTNAINQRTWAEIEGLFVADAIWDVRGTEPGGPEVFGFKVTTPALSSWTARLRPRRRP